MHRGITLTNNPIVRLLRQYKEMSKDDIVGHLADWYNVNGETTFNQAVKDETIIQEKNSWKLKEQMHEGIENLFGPPASQAFADTGNNPHIDHTKLGKPFAVLIFCMSSLLVQCLLNFSPSIL